MTDLLLCGLHPTTHALQVRLLQADLLEPRYTEVWRAALRRHSELLWKADAAWPKEDPDTHGEPSCFAIEGAESSAAAEGEAFILATDLKALMIELARMRYGPEYAVTREAWDQKATEDDLIASFA